ncbi:MAG: TlpA family protein disulfide reductase [Planctomycetota bacterium]|jgi:thiol-disulfide isomerase/thioredoxin
MSIRSTSRLAGLAFALCFTLPVELAEFGSAAETGASKPATTSLPDTLHWSNGDSLHGRLLSARDNRLLWKSPLFVDPVELDGRYLSLIEFGAPATDEDRNRDPLRVVSRNGDVLFARLSAIDDTFLTLTSRRQGTVRLRRDGIRLLERMDNPGLVYVGPQGAEEWTTLEQGQAFEKWQQLPEGSLSTTGWLAEIFRELPIPKQAEIEVTLESQDKLKFLIAFGDRPDDSIRIETWDDELVALAGDDFEPILTIGPSQKKVQLRLYLDREQGRLSIYSVAGKKLGEIANAKTRDTRTGFYLRNKGEQLQLNALRVSRWTGNPPQEITDRGTRIHLATGTAIYGALTDFDPQTQSLRLKSANETRSVPINEIDRVFLADDENDVPSSELAQAFYYDGTRITGNVVRIDNGQMLIKPNSAEAPIESPLAGMRRLVFRQPEDLPEDGHDRVLWEGGSLRGTLAGGDTPETAIQWRPVGAFNSTNLAPRSKARFVRSEKSEGIKYDRQKFNDMVFLTTRDVIPGRVMSIDSEWVELETAFAGANRIPSQFVRAIELADSAEPYVVGFGDEDWKTIGLSTDAVRRTDEELVFGRLSSIGHPDLLHGSDVTFRVNWDPASRATVGFALRNVDVAAGAVQPQFMINLHGESVFAGPFMNGAGIAGELRSQTDRIQRCESGEAVVRLRLTAQGLSLEVNDEVLFEYNDGWPKQSEFKGTGFGFAMFVDPGNDKTVTISDFSVNRSSGPRDRTEISDAVRQRALLIPRFRRDNPSTHVLVAPNGDILRGRLTGFSDGQISFESQLESFTFDRRRVASIVWLHPTGIEESPGWDTSRPVVRAVLNGNLMVSLQPEKMVDGRLVGHSPLLGRCAVPVGSIVELQAGGFGPIDDAQVYANWTPQAAPEPDIPVPGGDGSLPDLKESSLVGTPARNVSIDLLGGGRTSLRELEGKIVVLDFWATWCGPCVRAMPEVIKVVDEFREKGVVLIAVNQEEQERLIGAFLISNGLKVQVGLDRTAAIARQFGVDTIPQTFVIDQQGLIAAHAVGAAPRTDEALREVLQELVSRKSPAESGKAD